MPKCPFCKGEIDSVYEIITEENSYKLSLDGKGELYSKLIGSDLEKVYTCPKCGKELIHLWNRMDVRDFLKEKVIFLYPDDSEVKRRGEYVLYKGKIYKIIEKKKSGLLHLRLVEDELIADILGADLEDKEGT